MKLYEFLFERANELRIISLQGCEEDSFEIDLDNGEVKDCTDIADELSRMFRASGVRIMSIENPYSALIDSSGKVYGGLVVSHKHTDDYYEFGDDGGIITFSVVVDPAVRGQKLAEKLINDLINSNPHSLIRAEVINPLMEKILTNLGFYKSDESSPGIKLVYEKKPK